MKSRNTNLNDDKSKSPILPPTQPWILVLQVKELNSIWLTLQLSGRHQTLFLLWDYFDCLGRLAQQAWEFSEGGFSGFLINFKTQLGIWSWWCTWISSQGGANWAFSGNFLCFCFIIIYYGVRTIFLSFNYVPTSPPIHYLNFWDS